MEEESKHKYAPELYDFLKREYKIDKDKVRCIKLGMDKYGLPMKQIKEVVDFIADEIYEEENAKTLEEINTSAEQIEDYRFSFTQYFAHNLVWKLFVLCGLEIVLYKFTKETMGLGVIVALYVNVIVLIVILHQWAIASTSVFHTVGKLEYEYRTPVFGNEGRQHRGWSCYHYHNVKRIDSIKETPFSFVIYGKIEKRTELEYSLSTNTKVYTSKKLKLKKMFKNQNALIQKIEPKRVRK